MGTTPAQELLRFAYRFSAESPDPSTQNAAFLTGESGPLLFTAAVNEFPEGVHYSAERWERPIKYSYVEHAERNCLFKAAAGGLCTTGLTMVCPWAACDDCARAIIQCGISCLIRNKAEPGDTHPRWGTSIAIADIMLMEAGVDIIDVEMHGGMFRELDPIRRDGKLWQP